MLRISLKSLRESLWSINFLYSAFFNSIDHSGMCINMFREESLLQILKRPLLTGVVGLQPTACNTTKRELLTKFLKGALKFPGSDI